MAILITWLILAVLVGVLAAHKGRSGVGFFFLAVLLSPLIGFIIALIVDSREQQAASGKIVAGYKKCPFCAESVRSEATKCRHCGSELPPAPPTPPEVPLTTEERAANYNRMYNIK